MTAQAFINVIIPFETGYSGAVNGLLRQFAAPGCGNQPRTDIDGRLNDMGRVHFMSVTVADPVCPAELDGSSDRVQAGRLEPSHLLIEISADGGTVEVLHALAAVLEPELNALLQAAQITRNGKALGDYLCEHRVVIGSSWWSMALGQIFSGSPGLSARRIRAEACLAKHIGKVIEDQRQDPGWHQSSQRQRLERIRNLLWEEGNTKWAFVPEAAPCLAGSPDATLSVFNPQIWKAGQAIFDGLFSPLYLPVVLIFLGAVAFTMGRHGPAIDLIWAADVAAGVIAALLVIVAFAFGGLPLWPRLVLYFVAMLVLSWYYHDTIVESIWNEKVAVGLFIGAVAALAVLFAAAFLRLRYLEATDPAVDRTPNKDRVAALMEVENFCAQNHLASISRLKPGLLRRLTLRLAFIVVGTGQFVCAPGFLGKNGVIHFARWMRLPGTDQLLFWSNYDGTWEAYVADFIADAPTGVTAIWSNCVDFPRSSNLFGAGAGNQRDQLVRWARRQQHPTLLWYSAYRSLTAERIRINAAIRQGLASAESDADVRDWFSLFGSKPRPANALQTTQIPTLVFGGLSSLRFASCHIIAFGNDRSRCKEWLRVVAADATYGEALPGQTSALVVALAAEGLRKLGLPDDALATFPVAYQQGMWPASRARELGDTGESAPEKWQWGSGENGADALLVVYGATEAALCWRETSLTGETRRLQHRVVYSLRLQPRPAKYEEKDGSVVAVPKQFPPEPFGFADGISQPVILGTPRSMTLNASNDLVSPGEIVLGYPDNLGTIPPSPSIADGHDPGHILPDVGPDPFRQRPEFSSYEGQGRRDLGANGTFLVVRQLQQNVRAFEEWADRVIDDIKAETVVAESDHRIAMVWGNVAQERAMGPLPRPRRPFIRVDVTGNAAHRKLFRDAIKAKLVGRWQDGTSLVRHPEGPGTKEMPPAMPDNDFLLGKEDPTGLRCPFGAHIRRANPRDTRFPGSADEIASTNRHRILRVGRSYGAPPPDDGARLASDGTEKGLLFMCLNSDIERQFEFIQKSWLLNPNIQGLNNEVDPIMGRGPRIMTIPTPTGSVVLQVLSDFVTVKGGGYFFLPGRAVLRFLTN